MRIISADSVIAMFTKRINGKRRKATSVPGTENDEGGPVSAVHSRKTEGDGNHTLDQVALYFWHEGAKEVTGSGESSEARTKRICEEKKSKAEMQKQRRDYFGDVAKKAHDKNEAKENRSKECTTLHFALQHCYRCQHARRRDF